MAERADDTRRLPSGELVGAPQPAAPQAQHPGDPTPQLPAPPHGLPVVPGIELSHVLGEGGMGIVYAGTQSFLRRRVAVKFLKPEQRDANFTARLRREARLLAEMKHPNIVACYQADTSPAGDCYLVMEYIDGPSLRRWIEEHGPLATPTALTVCRDLALALRHALEVGLHHHGSGIIHRDVKPENVLLEPDENGAPGEVFPFVAKLADLGLARPVSSKAEMNLTQKAASMGTPATMAPEQYGDPENVDFRADIYGLGCVLYYALVGEPAFRGQVRAILFQKLQPLGPDPRRHRPELQKDVAQLVMRMLAGDRERRAESYAQLVGELERLIEATRASPPDRRRRMVFAGIAMLVLAAAGAGLALRPRSAAPPREPEPPRVNPVPAPAFSFENIEIDPPMPREGQEVQLIARTLEPRPGEAHYRWRQIAGNGPALDMERADETVLRFLAPQAKKPYPVTLEIVRSAPGEDDVTENVTVTVDAVDDPASIEIQALPRGELEPGDEVVLEAQASDPEGETDLVYEWSRSGPPEPVGSIGDRGPRAGFVVPDADHSYDIEVTVEVGGAGLPVAARRTLHVRVEEPLEIPGLGIPMPLFPEDGTDFPSPWRRADPPGSVFAPGEGGSNEVFASWVDAKQIASRAVPLPRARWTLSGAFQLYVPPKQELRQGGLRIEYRSDRAIALRMVNAGSSARIEVVRLERLEEGTWNVTESLAKPDAAWEFEADFAFELDWDGGRLSVSEKVKGDARPILERQSIDLGTRPTALVLYAYGNQVRFSDFVLVARR